MNEEVFYDIKSVPLADRESFNNTILLLTMVKSKYYYMIGFSRPEAKIVVGFDYASKMDGKITRELTIDFDRFSDVIVLNCVIAELSDNDARNINIPDRFKNIFFDGRRIKFEQKIKKDGIFPSSVKAMNKYLLSARKEIELFLTQCV